MRWHLLLDSSGQWRHDLWLDELVQPAEASSGPAAEAKPILTTPLPINSCSVDSLTLLPRVGPVLAGRIEAARQDGVVFRCPDDLELVKGIGPALATRLAPLVMFAADSLQAASLQSIPVDTLPRAAHKQR